MVLMINFPTKLISIQSSNIIIQKERRHINEYAEEVSHKMEQVAKSALGVSHLAPDSTETLGHSCTIQILPYQIAGYYF